MGKSHRHNIFVTSISKLSPSKSHQHHCSHQVSSGFSPKIGVTADGIILLKDRIQRMVTGQITDQMGKPVTASPVSTSVYSSLVRTFART